MYSKNQLEISRPQRADLADDFEVTTLQCLCLSLPRSSKSPELVQLLRSNAFQLGPPNDGFRKEREEIVTASLTYIEVSGGRPRPFYVSVPSPYCATSCSAAKLPTGEVIDIMMMNVVSRSRRSVKVFGIASIVLRD
jgi:hypothetical protein